MNELESVRIDRWLHAVRLFKTRSQAARAISGGKVKLNGVTAKPHRLIKIGDQLRMKRDGRSYQYTVRSLIEKRVGAKEAVKHYDCLEDPDLDPQARLMVETLRQIDHQTTRPRGRPTKRDRRKMDELKWDT